MDTNVRWNVMIIFAHDGQTFFEYNDLEDSILRQDKFDTKYSIFYYDIRSKTAIVKKLVSKTANERTTWYFNIEYRIGDVDIYNPDDDSMAKYFEYIDGDLSENVNSGLHYRNLLIMWGHSSGLGFCSPPLDFKNENPFVVELNEISGLRKEQIEKIQKFASELFIWHQIVAFQNLSELIAGHLQNMFKDLLPETIDKLRKFLLANFKMVTAKRLRKSLEEGWVNRDVDVLLSINCYTQLMEVGYELIGKVKLYVAPQTTIPITGLNYYSLFRQLETKPTIDVADMSSDIVTCFKIKYNTEPFITYFKKRYPGFYELWLPKISFSCFLFESQEKPSFKEPVKKIVSGIKKIGIPEAVKYILKARNVCREMDTPDGIYGAIDFEFFLETVIKETEGIDNAELKNGFSDFLEVKKSSLKEMLVPTDPTMYGLNRSNPKSVSIFFPSNISTDMHTILINYYRDEKTSSFQKETGWLEIVNYFWDA